MFALATRLSTLVRDFARNPRANTLAQGGRDDFLLTKRARPPIEHREIWNAHRYRQRYRRTIIIISIINARAHGIINSRSGGDNYRRPGNPARYISRVTFLRLHARAPHEIFASRHPSTIRAIGKDNILSLLPRLTMKLSYFEERETRPIAAVRY